LTKKGRICLPLLLATLILLAFVTAAERSRRQHAEESAAQDENER
jgi:sensor domain CHASE-containing protein